MDRESPILTMDLRTILLLLSFAAVAILSIAISWFIGWRGGLLNQNIGKTNARAWWTCIWILTPMSSCALLLIFLDLILPIDSETGVALVIVPFIVVGVTSFFPAMFVSSIGFRKGLSKRLQDQAQLPPSQDL